MKFSFVYRGNVLGQSPYSKGHPNCVESGLTDSRRYFGLCGEYIFINNLGIL